MDGTKFADECLWEREVTQRPGATPIQTQLERENKSKNSWSIAQKGYSITDHKCAQIFFSKALNREDLAKALSRAYNARIAFNYRNNLSDYTDKAEAEDFLQREVAPFIEEVEKLLKAK